MCRVCRSPRNGRGAMRRTHSSTFILKSNACCTLVFADNQRCCLIHLWIFLNGLKIQSRLVVLFSHLPFCDNSSWQSLVWVLELSMFFDAQKALVLITCIIKTFPPTPIHSHFAFLELSYEIDERMIYCIFSHKACLSLMLLTSCFASLTLHVSTYLLW